MTRAQVISQIKLKASFLCVGLDTDVAKLPAGLKGIEGVLNFNQEIIEATKDFAVSYKINTAFYEAMGIDGWQALSETVRMIPKDCLSILDAKRGDIGNTGDQYAKAFFGELDADAVTVAPYMGHDSIKPFLQFEGKWAIVLALTSNSGSEDFQQLRLADGRQLYQAVVANVASWGTVDNLMFVAGATRGTMLADLRKQIPDHFLLVPGVGAQGGSLTEVCQAALTKDCGLLVNSSRQIIYASSGPDFADKARQAAHELQTAMELELQKVDFLA